MTLNGPNWRESAILNGASLQLVSGQAGINFYFKIA